MAIKLNKRMKLLFTCMLAGVIFSPASAVARDLVVVSAANNLNGLSLSKFELRKIFLGYKVNKDGQAISAVRNIIDKDAYQLFLSQLIRLSDRNYEKRLMSKTFKTGLANVPKEKSLEAVYAELQRGDAVLSFMWLDEAQAEPGVSVIQTIGEDD